MVRRILITFLCCFTITCASCPSALAANASPSWRITTVQGAPADDVTLTDSEVAYWRDRTAAKEAEMAASHPAQAKTTRSLAGVTAVATGLYGYHTLAANNYRQENDHYCGPASARQSLSWHKKNSGSTATLPSQSTLAAKIGTTSSGSVTSKIAPALNSYDGIFGRVNYVASNLTDTGSPTSAFYTRIGWMLEDARTVPIILTATQRITRYGGHASRHYMSVSGINDTAASVSMRSVDPNYSSAYYGTFWDPMGSTTANGLCRACYQADVDGTNMAMCW